MLMVPVAAHCNQAVVSFLHQIYQSSPPVTVLGHHSTHHNLWKSMHADPISQILPAAARSLMSCRTCRAHSAEQARTWYAKFAMKSVCSLKVARASDDSLGSQSLMQPLIIARSHHDFAYRQQCIDARCMRLRLPPFHLAGGQIHSFHAPECEHVPRYMRCLEQEGGCRESVVAEFLAQTRACTAVASQLIGIDYGTCTMLLFKGRMHGSELSPIS